MAKIPLEDTFTDIIGKAQRGSKLADAELSERAGIGVDELTAAKAGTVNETVLRKLATALHLAKAPSVDSAKKAWYPLPHDVPGLAQFNTPYEDMTVNAYLVWDTSSRQAIVF